MGKTSNQFHSTRLANGLRTTLQVNANRRPHVIAKINDRSTKFQLVPDSGIIIISFQVWENPEAPNWTTHLPLSFNVSSASSNNVPLEGSLKCTVSINCKSCQAVCHVSQCSINLLGLDWIDVFDILEVGMPSTDC